MDLNHLIHISILDAFMTLLGRGSWYEIIIPINLLIHRNTIGYSLRLDVGLVATFEIEKSHVISDHKKNLLFIRKRVYFHKNSVWLAYFKYKRVKFVHIYSKIDQNLHFAGRFYRQYIKKYAIQQLKSKIINLLLLISKDDDVIWLSEPSLSKNMKKYIHF